MLEVVVGVVGVAMNWLSTCVHDILCRDGREVSSGPAFGRLPLV